MIAVAQTSVVRKPLVGALVGTTVIAIVVQIMSKLDVDSIDTIFRIGSMVGSLFAGYIAGRKGSKDKMKSTDTDVKQNTTDISNLFRNYAEMEHELRLTKSELAKVQKANVALQADYSAAVRERSATEHENKALNRRILAFQVTIEENQQMIIKLKNRIIELETSSMQKQDKET